MYGFSVFLKNRLISIIKEMASAPWLFTKCPEKDFTRRRKLDFETLINMILSIGNNSIDHEIMDYFDYDISSASSSAFIQQRRKILPLAFEYLLNEFTNSFHDLKTFDGHRLMAVDGSDMGISLNPDDHDTYLNPIPGSKGFNQLHLNALYDLCNKLYVDALIQPGRKVNEAKALTDLIDRSSMPGKVIVIADRGYESYNVLAHIEQKGWNYVIRVKDIHSSGILSTRQWPEEDEFDEIINLVLTRKQTKEVKAHPELYRFITSTSPFDFLDLHKEKFYPMTFRVVRFRISEETYETIITNLSSEEFPSEKIKHLYHLRWGIETSFRELKYALGLTYFHSKKVEYIYQEVFASLIMYNFCEMITLHVIIQQKDTKHTYQANFTAAIRICRYFYKCRDNIHPPDVEALIQKNILPVRNGRNDPRKVKTKSAISFNYRIA